MQLGVQYKYSAKRSYMVDGECHCFATFLTEMVYAGTQRYKSLASPNDMI